MSNTHKYYNRFFAEEYFSPTNGLCLPLMIELLQTAPSLLPLLLGVRRRVEEHQVQVVSVQLSKDGLMR